MLVVSRSVHFGCLFGCRPRTISIIEFFQARANALENTTAPSTQEETMGPESFDQEEIERHRNRIGRVKYKPAIRSFRVIKVRQIYTGGLRLVRGRRNHKIGLIKRNGSSNQKPIQIEFHLTWPIPRDHKPAQLYPYAQHINIAAYNIYYINYIVQVAWTRKIRIAFVGHLLMKIAIEAIFISFLFLIYDKKYIFGAIQKSMSNQFHCNAEKALFTSTVDSLIILYL